MSENFSDRDGYKSGFLGEGLGLDLPVPMPGLGEHEADVLRVDDPQAETPFELRYRHFSVVLSKSRKFTRVTAVNINGEEPFFSIPRRSWRKDPRAVEFQEGDEVLYGPTTFSRGHMVRRQDPLWGTKELAKQANSDTFYLGNAVPQVQSFNDGLWGDLEDHILGEGKSRRGRLTVFTGPILTDNDPVYVNDTIAVPLLFYKVVVALKESEDALLATAFIQSQEDVMPPEGGFPGGFEPGLFTPYQVKLSTLEGMTGLSFGLGAVDVLKDEDTSDMDSFGAGGIPGLKVLSSEKIKFG